MSTDQHGRPRAGAVGFSRRTAWDLACNPLAQAVARAGSDGRRLLDLTESNPTRCGLHYDEQAILRAFSNPGALAYAPEPRGMHSARAAVGAYYAEHGAHLDAGQLLLTTSTSEAYSFLFRLLCDPGESVVVPAPSYPLLEFLATLDDVDLESYELVYHDGWQIDFTSLAAACSSRTRAVMLVHPNNPTGSYVKPHEAEQLNEFCAARRLALIVDEVFLDYALSPPPGTGRDVFTFARNREVLTFTLSGLSKIAALPQMKAAWMAVSGPPAQQLAALERLEVIADTFLSMSTPVQLALPHLLEQRRTIVPQLTERVQKNLAELDRRLAAQQAVERLAIEGGWYAVLRIPAAGADDDFAVALVERAGVMVHPGHFYDFRREGYVVVSLITSEDVFAEGIALTVAAAAAM